MKKIIVVFCFLISGFITNAQEPVFNWVKQFSPFISSTAVDVIGDIYIVGDFVGIKDFDPGKGVFNLGSIGERSIYVSKLDSSGSLIWAKQIRVKYGEACAVAVDYKGSVYVTGYFTDTVDFDTGEANYNMISSGGGDTYVLKLNSDGDFVWACKREWKEHDYGSTLAIDPFGNVYVKCLYQHKNPIRATGIFHVDQVLSYDIMLLKFDSSGVFLWEKKLTESFEEYGQALQTDPDGNIYIACHFSGYLDFAPEKKGAGIFILKMDSAGNIVWSNCIEGLFFGWHNVNRVSMVLEQDLNVYVASTFIETVDFDAGTGVTNLKSSDNLGGNMFILKLNNAGNFIWVRKPEAVDKKYSPTSATSIAVDSSNNVYTTGWFDGTVDFDPGKKTFVLNSEGYEDIFIWKLDSSGDYKWAGRIGSISNEYGYSIYADAAYNLYVNGCFNRSTDLDPEKKTFYLTPETSNVEYFILKLNQLNNQ